MIELFKQCLLLHLLKLLLVKVKQKVYLETILHLLKIKYISSYQGFKDVQYVDLFTTCVTKNYNLKSVKIFFSNHLSRF